MADPNIPVREDDIRYEDRGGAFVLVDPTNPERRDVATAWSDDSGRWRWRLTGGALNGHPYPSAAHRDGALDGMLADYLATNPDIAARFEKMRSRFSFGAPQIFKAP